MTISALIDRMLPEFLVQLPHYFTRPPAVHDGILSDEFALWKVPVSSLNFNEGAVVVSASSDGIEITLPDHETVVLSTMQVVDLCWHSACLLVSAGRPVFGGRHTLPTNPAGLFSELHSRFVLKRVALRSADTRISPTRQISVRSGSFLLTTQAGLLAQSTSVSCALLPCDDPECEACALSAQAGIPVAVVDIDLRTMQELIPILLSATGWMEERYPASMMY